MGHCVSNSTVEKFESKLNFEVKKNSKEISIGMKTTPEFNTLITWNKFDRFVETKSGKNTLHDAAEIVNQMHSEKSANFTYSLPLSQQPGIRQK